MDPSITALLGALMGAGASIATIIVHSFISQNERTTRFRLAAINRRIEVHQQAFKLWIHIFWAIHTDDVDELVFEAQEWWTKNCLYLDPESRQTFYRTLVKARSFRMIESAEERKEEMEDIRRTGDLILAGASLPPIGDVTKIGDD